MPLLLPVIWGRLVGLGARDGHTTAILPANLPAAAAAAMVCVMRWIVDGGVLWGWFGSDVEPLSRLNGVPTRLTRFLCAGNASRGPRYRLCYNGWAHRFNDALHHDIYLYLHEDVTRFYFSCASTACSRRRARWRRHCCPTLRP